MKVVSIACDMISQQKTRGMSAVLSMFNSVLNELR